MAVVWTSQTFAFAKIRYHSCTLYE